MTLPTFTRILLPALLALCLAAPSQAEPAGEPGATRRAISELRRPSEKPVEAPRPSGGGIFDIYAGQVILAVQPHLSYAAIPRENLAVQVLVVMDAKGNVQDCTVKRSSGNEKFDAAAVNAVIRTGQLPKPPRPDLQELVINFNAQAMPDR